MALDIAIGARDDAYDAGRGGDLPTPTLPQRLRLR